MSETAGRNRRDLRDGMLDSEFVATITIERIPGDRVLNGERAGKFRATAFVGGLETVTREDIGPEGANLLLATALYRMAENGEIEF